MQSTQQLSSILQGKRYFWSLPGSPDSQLYELAAAYNMSLPVMEVLLRRGYASKGLLDAYLFSYAERDVADAGLFADAERAVKRILRAIERKERILIFGDYDVDGMSATALVMRCLLQLGAEVNFYMPSRMRDGYGISASVVRKAAQNKYSLIITVDNGITAFEAAQEAVRSGIDLIITDHHRPHATLPEAYAIVNHQRADCQYPCKYLAGVGVAFKLMQLLYEKLNLPLPPKVYELLTLGTIADVVPLLDENRYWVQHGLAHINRNLSVPLRVLKQNSRLERPQITATDIAFSIAPQLNALGRMSDARSAISFLIGSDELLIQEIGKTLGAMNEARKETERGIYSEIEAAIIEKRIDVTKENCIVAAHHSWPTGVIGLVASRLVSAYGKPTILLHCTQKGIAKGSCRSIPAFNIFQALEAEQDLLEHFGGHSMAAGLALKVENVPKLKQRLEERISATLTPFDLQQKIQIDAMIQLSDVNHQLANDLKRLEPFGNGNEQPVFGIKNAVQIQKPQLLKDYHVKCMLFSDGVAKPVIFFNRPELYPQLLERGEEPLSCAAYISENHWNDRVNIELQGIDVAW